MSQTAVHHSLSKLIELQGTVSWSEVSHPIQVLVDSGADDNFIDAEFVSQTSISSEPLT